MGFVGGKIPCIFMAVVALISLASVTVWKLFDNSAPCATLGTERTCKYFDFAIELAFFYFLAGKIVSNLNFSERK